jgi:8-oxo-dGTP diphosphatase
LWRTHAAMEAAGMAAPAGEIHIDVGGVRTGYPPERLRASPDSVVRVAVDFLATDAQRPVLGRLAIEAAGPGRGDMTSDDARLENSAKAVILDGDKVLLLRYLDRKMGLGVWYSLPGGRQQFGETLCEALVRECREEIGAEITPGRLLFVREYIHSRHDLAGKGRDQHKIEFYFLGQLNSEVEADYVADDAVSDEGQQGLCWRNLAELRDLNIFPTGLRQLGETLKAGDAEVYWGDTY